MLVLDLVALAGLYLAGMFYTTNLPMDQYWWWWVIHLWVEATWEVMVGCIMAWGLIKTLGARRRIVTTWLYIEVALMFGSGILGLGHHYFWIGTPEYWLGVGGFFSALEPIPLVAMVVHAVYDAGRHAFRANNHPALAWLIAHAFGNFLGAGVWGFMQTLPQINLYTHGTQWSSSHGHLAFFGAYVTIIVTMLYIAMQRLRGNVWMSAGLQGAWRWKWALGLTHVGMMGMTIALLITGYEQSFVEPRHRRLHLAGLFRGPDPSPGSWRRCGGAWHSGVLMTLGVVLLLWDLVRIGVGEERPMKAVGQSGRYGGGQGRDHGRCSLGGSFLMRRVSMRHWEADGRKSSVIGGVAGSCSGAPGRAQGTAPCSGGGSPDDGSREPRHRPIHGGCGGRQG